MGSDLADVPSCADCCKYTLHRKPRVLQVALDSEELLPPAVRAAIAKLFDEWTASQMGDLHRSFADAERDMQVRTTDAVATAHSLANAQSHDLQQVKRTLDDRSSEVSARLDSCQAAQARHDESAQEASAAMQKCRSASESHGNVTVSCFARATHSIWRLLCTPRRNRPHQTASDSDCAGPLRRARSQPHNSRATLRGVTWSGCAQTLPAAMAPFRLLWTPCGRSKCSCANTWRMWHSEQLPALR